MLEITIREPMVDVEQALDAARASVIDGGMVERPRAACFSPMRTAGGVGLITPATEGIVDVTIHGPVHRLKHPIKTPRR
ncbi:hypothetical protein BSR47_04140 [Bradyrhizobium canariense]|nr:hypothetical protein BSR47_04140 [Bradyrhizobium canariense]